MNIEAITNNIYNKTNINKVNSTKKTFENILNNVNTHDDSDKKLKEACCQYERFFVNQIFKEMRNTVHSGGLIKKSQGEKVFEDMLYDEYSNNIAKQSGIGIADLLYKQLSKK